MLYNFIGYPRTREKDVATWNSVIGGLAIHGHAEESINLFVEM
jgi:pentatricopeptide repeat protein